MDADVNVISLAPRVAASLPAAKAQNASDAPALLRRLRRTGVIAILVWVALFGLWAGGAPLSGAVVGTGLVKVDANRLTVTHRDGGTVARVLVREGELVRQGQPLIVLTDLRIDSTVDLLQAQLASERLRRSRLEAEAAQQPAWTPPAIDGEGPARLRADEAVHRERSAFDARLRTLRTQTEAARSQIAEAETEMQAHELEARAAAEALELARDELASNEALLKENFVNRARVLGVRRAVADYDSKLQGSRAELSKARQKRTELEGRMRIARESYVQSATEDLRDATAKIIDLEERLRSGQDQAIRQTVYAPSAGRLVDLKVNTAGSALGAREPIVDIVPSDAPRIVEVRISADAISDVRPGLPVEVKLLAYKQRTTGVIEGRVSNISADALVDARSGSPYFAVQAEVSPEALARAGPLALLPGMAAEVFIRTSDRTALDFLLDPLTAAMRRSLREH